MKQEVASVISNREVMPGVYLIWLKSPQVTATVRPGQFVMVHCGEEILLRRPLSVHQVDDDKLAFLYAVVGKGTYWLSQCIIDDKIDLLGPLGNGFSINPDSQRLLLVAGGLGIAPLYLLAQESLRWGYQVVLLYGTANDRRYPVAPEIEVVAATEDGTTGHKGMITDLLPEHVTWADQIFTCGPTLMYHTLAAQNQQFLKGKPVQISLEVRMGCGLGVCYGCTVGTRSGLKQSCQDGPVFNLEDIIWDGS